MPSLVAGSLVRRGIATTVVAATTAACGTVTLNGLGVNAGAPTPPPPQALSLGQLSIGTSPHRYAALNVADSVLYAWGWRVASVDSVRRELTTSWLYFSDPQLTRTNGQPCDDGASVGLRLEVVPAGGSDANAYSVRAQATIPPQSPAQTTTTATTRYRRASGPTTNDLQRAARTGFGTIAAELAHAMPSSFNQPDTLLAAVSAVSGAGGIGGAAGPRACATLGNP